MHRLCRQAQAVRSDVLLHKVDQPGQLEPPAVELHGTWRYGSSKVGNTRALEYFKKCGIITPANKHIDYKSAIVQKYKALLTEEVDNIVQGKTTTAPVPQQVKPVEVEKPELEKKESQVETNIQNKAD